MTVSKSTKQMADMLMKRMENTRNWIYKEKIKDDSGNFRIEDKKVKRSLIDRQSSRIKLLGTQPEAVTL